MRDFARPDTLLHAALATMIGTVACLPQLYQWTSRPDAIGMLAALLGWCLFVMWAFVFAWGPRQGGLPTLPLRFSWFNWGKLTAAALAAGILIASFLDEEYRRLFPAESAGDLRQWTAGLLFNLSLQQLFLCFAPLAFFARLGAGPKTALGLTVALTLTVLTMKITRSPATPSAFAIVGLVMARGLLAAATVLIYRRGGVPAVWWMALLLQARHLPRILTPD